MLLLGLLDRPTNDLDVVAQLENGQAIGADPLPQALREAVTDVATALDLPPEWLSAGPVSLLDLGLPEGFAARGHLRRGRTHDPSDGFRTDLEAALATLGVRGADESL